MPMILMPANGPYPSEDKLPSAIMITPTKTVALLLLHPNSSSKVETALSVNAIELVTAANSTSRKIGFQLLSQIPYSQTLLEL